MVLCWFRIQTIICDCLSHEHHEVHISMKYQWICKTLQQGTEGMTLENNRAPLLYYIKIYASFQSHVWIQMGVTVQKRSIRVKISNLLSPVTLKFDGWPWKTIGHLLYVALSFVYHFIAISEFKLELESGNAQFWSKSMFFSCVTLKFDRWPWKTIGHLFYATASFVHHFVAIGEFKLELQSGNAQFGSKLTIFVAIWPWNLTDDLEKQ